VNHGLRGSDSLKDASLVRRLGKKFALPVEVTRVDVSKLAAENGESIELAARNVRHQFFAQCASLHRCPRVLLAHHVDDQAETVLFNLLRGSSGLKGMEFQSSYQVGQKKLQFFRPLLETTRAEINDYVAQRKINYREDHSNSQAVATRNRLRNEVIPLLEDIMGRDIKLPIVKAAVTSKSKTLALQEILESYQLEDPQGRLFIPKLIKLSPALQQMALHDYLKKNNVSEISSELIKRCLNLLENPDISKTNLPEGRYFRRKEKRLFVD